MYEKLQAVKEFDWKAGLERQLKFLKIFLEYRDIPYKIEYVEKYALVRVLGIKRLKIIVNHTGIVGLD